MSHFENSKLAGTKRLRTSTVAFDPTPAKRASPPKSSALKSPPDKTPSFGVVSLRMRDAISEEEDLFARWLDAVHGRHIPGLSLGEARDDRFEEWLCDVLVSEL
jgi:hypothetical protein